MRDFYIPEARSQRVDVVIGGHSHLYQRGASNGVHYFIIGGGGGDLEDTRVKDYRLYSKTSLEHHHVVLELTGCEFKWQVTNIRNEMIDEVILTSKTCFTPLD